MASPQVEAQMLAWKAAELTAACASCAAWKNATGWMENCTYRDEAIRLATDMQTALAGILTDLSAQKKEAA